MQITVRGHDAKPAKLWCCERGLNSRPHPYQDSGLPEKPCNSHKLASAQGADVSVPFAHSCAETVRAEANETLALTPTHLSLLERLDAQRAHDARRRA